MTSSIAIFIKQFQDFYKNAGVFLQFTIFPVMAFLMTYVVDIPDMPNDMQGAYFSNMFAGMFVGMTLVNVVAVAIAEDRGRNSLRFLLMAGVKSHEYLLGIGGVAFVCALATNSLFTIMMPGISLTQGLIMLASLMLGAIASVLIGAILGLSAKNEQAATSYSMAAGMFLGFGPMIANLSGNEAMEKIFRLFYTMNFVSENFDAPNIFQRLATTGINILVLSAAFAWVYGKQNKKTLRTQGDFGKIKSNRKAVGAMFIMVIR
jgi:ABC-2 type transport system permease protein